ncbi:aspartic peptidase domain-containing protein [Hysterangium stoloniferum]|nr:aspartic peptidase domain-containing protein [Hysterangium stoloniferum]
MLRAFVILALSSSYCFASSDQLEAKRGLTATLPITRRASPSLGKRQKSAAIGLGDNRDALYSVLIQVGETSIPLNLDTGSSDLWSISTDCFNCFSSTAPKISTSSFIPSGLGIEFDYGDSTHPTSAIGGIVSGPVSIAGMQVQNQFLGAVNFTNTVPIDHGLSGIFGAGFPINSFIFAKLVFEALPPEATDTQIADKVISVLPAQAPLLSRLVLDGQLAQPMFTVTLQRETIEVGGNVGQLTIGQLPEGVSNDSLTWVPVRLYTEAQGGISGPSNNPTEHFPIGWEVAIDDIFLNGQKLPQPTLPTGTGYTALIDSASFCISMTPCPSNVCNKREHHFLRVPTTHTPVNLTFIIGGKSFPVDPRDFLGQQTSPDSPPQCTPDSTLLITDPPSPGALHSWILGTVFMNTFVAFYFGNLTNPAADPPRIGFLSTVPSNADAALLSDVQSASTAISGFIASSVSAPAGTLAATTTNSLGVAQAPTGATGNTSTTSSARPSSSSGGTGSGGGSGSGSGSGQNTALSPWVFLVSLILCVFRLL